MEVKEGENATVKRQQKVDIVTGEQRTKREQQRASRPVGQARRIYLFYFAEKMLL